MSEALARLRILSNEKNDKGSPESRDSVLSTFLHELEGVVCEEVIQMTDTHVLRALYVKWCNAIEESRSDSYRHRLLASAVMLTHLVKPIEDKPDNVFTLHGRH